MLTQLRDKGLLWPAVMTLAGVILGLSLGTWQLQRRAWKNELVSTIEARTGIAPLPPEAWPNLKCKTAQEVGLELSCEYMKVTLRGTWDHSRERHVFISVPRQPSGVGGPGYWVFTPLKFADGNGEVIVNRGFVPAGAKDAAQRVQGQIATAGRGDRSAAVGRTQDQIQRPERRSAQHLVRAQSLRISRTGLHQAVAADETRPPTAGPSSLAVLRRSNFTTAARWIAPAARWQDRATQSPSGIRLDVVLACGNPIGRVRRICFKSL